MARRISLGLAAGLVAAVVVITVLLATVWSGEVRQEIGTRLVKAAAGQRGVAVLSLTDSLRIANAEHPAFACAGEDSTLRRAQIVEELVSGLQLPAGNWLVSERGRAEGTSYVVVYSSEAGSSNEHGFGADLRDVGLPEGTLSCLVPKASST